MKSATVRCRCGVRHEGDAFTRLRRVQVLDRDELARIVVHWPAGVVVDVRACNACGREISRLSAC